MRSPLLMSRDRSALLVIDVQEKLIPAISGHEKVVWNVGRLVSGATELGMAVRATEQYPKGLGHTVESVKSLLPDSASDPASSELPVKAMFSCRECVSLFEELRAAKVVNLLLCGIEAHVCVLQTALDCVANGFNVFIAVDAVGSRAELDCQFALRRMETSGCILTTVEAALFEWCETSTAAEFKAISQLVRDPFAGT